MPWHLTPGQRHLLEQHGSGQRHVVGPTPDMKPLDGSQRIGGHAVGDLLALSALEDLAEQGNLVAREMASRLRRRMQADGPTIYIATGTQDRDGPASG